MALGNGINTVAICGVSTFSIECLPQPLSRPALENSALESNKDVLQRPQAL